MHFDIEPGAEHAGGNLTITIEEPEAGRLFLRFAYVTGFAPGAGSEDEAYGEYIKSAYRQSDIDCVRIIRTLAAGGNPQ
ncbi:AtaL-like protein [Azonexus sp.]|uniref:AtaL-like protein n=1 Tax=Azonexus sp. TaxID=1872668 RepID=UPI00283A9952|nr:AtaL-like protein [Azonexus sp.]